MSQTVTRWPLFVGSAVWILCSCCVHLATAADVTTLLGQIGVTKGVCVVVASQDHRLPVQLAEQSELFVFVHSPSKEYVTRTRQSAYSSGLLGTRIYVEHGPEARISLADNLADAVVVIDSVIPKSELLRVAQPGAKVIDSNSTFTKTRPVDEDDWSHPYHGPDNNPRSRDAHAKPPYLTQFLCDPWYVPMPQVTVTSGGRIFKAFGHIALKTREWPWLNTLIAKNAYNGTQLWKRELNPEFMIHRSTMIATPHVLYVADSASCKLLDAANGDLLDEIVIPENIDADGVWKWMALDGGVLYALVGSTEQNDPVIRGSREKAGWPWADLGDRYNGQEYAWGFGRTLVAINPATQEVIWTYRFDEPIDSRAMCLAAGRVYVYSPLTYLAAIDTKTGVELWKTSDPGVLQAIGENDRAQTAAKGFASTAYTKANDRGLFFAGPQRANLVAISADDGSLMWTYPHGNFQLVLHDNALYAMGRTETCKKFDYLTGHVLADLQCYRGNCTRATATVDSIFTRGYRHTGTMQLNVSTNEVKRIPLMRPACQDGVIVSNGMLYWGPWMCDCNHSLVGMISLAPAGNLDLSQPAVERDRLDSIQSKPVSNSAADEADWPAYRRDLSRSAHTPARLASNPVQRWQISSNSGSEPTAPIMVGDTAFWSGLDGVVRAADVMSGKTNWTAFTGGAVRFPPEYWNGRIYVGSGDGYVYCLDAHDGQLLWKFQAAPAKRRIMVHGNILSNWPVGSGVLVHEGVVYAAAGITSYDGTHVYALDARSGDIRWQNNHSGRLVSDDLVSGVSVQGHLLIHDDVLYLAGGNIVSPAMYDLDTGRCLNTIEDEWLNQPTGTNERFPSQPERTMFTRSPRGRELFVVEGEVRVFDRLLYSAPNNGPSRYFGGHFLQAGKNGAVIRGTNDRIVRLSQAKTPEGEPIGIWDIQFFRDPHALALCRDAVVVAGEVRQEESKMPTFGVAAFDLEQGSELWSQVLPSAAVSWGLAVNRHGCVVVTSKNGTVTCFGSRDASEGG